MNLSAGVVFSRGGYIAGRGVYLNGVHMFSLVKEVKIPPRLKMIEAVEGEIPTLLGKLQRAMGDL